jgi:putative hydrolase of the HAD superfamily
MIRAIIFDCFGVLTTEGWLPFKDKYFGDDSEKFHEASEARRMVDAGLMSYGDFVAQMAKLAGVSIDQIDNYIGHNVANEQLLEYIAAELRPHYKIGMLSNAGGNLLERFFSPEQIKLFDAVALSYEMGITKPDRRAYLKIAEKLGVEPEECVFVDDQERHCTAAREAGMKAILYEDFTQMRVELKQLLS